MSLLDDQRAFCAEISADDDAPASSPGMAIYRNAYRARLLGALEVSFERTRRWCGAEAFEAAACHYVLANPPGDWTLDLYGADFPELLAELFAEDGEVAELAWLEWAMQRAFAAVNAPCLDPAALAESGLDGTDWDRAGFAMAAGFALRRIETDCTALWQALAAQQADDEAPPQFTPARASPAWLAVWRVALVPHYRVLPLGEGAALDALARGATLGDLARDHPAEQLGGWLAQWLGEGLLSALVPAA